MSVKIKAADMKLQKESSTSCGADSGSTASCSRRDTHVLSSLSRQNALT